MSRLATSLCGIDLENPIIAASGTYGYGVEFEPRRRPECHRRHRGEGPVARTDSRQPPSPAVGSRLRDDQLHRPTKHRRAGIPDRKTAQLRPFRTKIFANVFGYRRGDYAEVVRILEDGEGLAGYELNVSCPNTKHGGMFFSSDPVLLAELVTRFAPDQAPADR